MSEPQLLDHRLRTRYERVLIDHEQPYRTTIRLVGTHAKCFAQSARPDGIVADLAQRGTKQSARPLIGHHDQYARCDPVRRMRSH